MVALRYLVFAPLAFVVLTIVAAAIEQMATESGLVGGLLNMFSEIASAQWFHWLGGAAIGFAAGVWLDAYVRERDQRAQKWVDTRLRLQRDPAGTRNYHQERASNIESWQQLVVQLKFEGAPGSDLPPKEIQFDTIIVTFKERFPYSRPIIETFGHKLESYTFHPIGQSAAAFQFVDKLNVPLAEIWFPPPNHYEKIKVASEAANPSMPAQIRASSDAAQ